MTTPELGTIRTRQVTGVGAAVYVLGACLGALFFGWLTDRFGRKKLFILTLVGDTVLAFVIGAVLMIVAGLVEAVLGVRAERRSLEDLARPLSAADQEATAPA